MTPAVPSSTFNVKQQDALDAAFQPLDADLTTFAANGYATQANQEAGTAGKAVTSDVQQFHPSAAKCWAYVTVSAGTPTLQASYNITSITDSGVGLLTITIATDFSSVNWAAAFSIIPSVVGYCYEAGGRTAGSIAIQSIAGSTDGASDPQSYSFVGFGDQ